MKNGKHLIVDAYGCDKERLYNKELISELLGKVTKEIGLRPLSEPLLYDVTEDMLTKKDVGTTGVIIFMESHFTFHAFPEQNYFSADIYSCKGFEHVNVLGMITSAFLAKELESTILIRGREL